MLSFRSYLKLLNEQTPSNFVDLTLQDGRVIKVPPGTRLTPDGKRVAVGGTYAKVEDLYNSQQTSKQSSTPTSGLSPELNARADNLLSTQASFVKKASQQPTPDPAPSVERNADGDWDLRRSYDGGTVVSRPDIDVRRANKLKSLRSDRANQLVGSIPDALSAARRIYNTGNNREAALNRLVPQTLQGIGNYSSRLTGGRSVADLVSTGMQPRSTLPKFPRLSGSNSSSLPDPLLDRPNRLTSLKPPDPIKPRSLSGPVPSRQDVMNAGGAPAPLSPQTTARVKAAGVMAGVDKVKNWE